MAKKALRTAPLTTRRDFGEPFSYRVSTICVRDIEVDLWRTFRKKAKAEGVTVSAALNRVLREALGGKA